MPLSEATISYDLADLTGVDFDARRTKVWASTNVPGDTVIDTDGNKIRLGAGSGTVSTDGTGSIAVWIPGAGSNPASWQTYIHVDYPDRQATGGRGKRTFGPFTITASANLADLVDEQEVPATYITALTQELDGYATDAANSAAVAVAAADSATAIAAGDLSAIFATKAEAAGGATLRTDTLRAAGDRAKSAGATRLAYDDAAQVIELWSSTAAWAQPANFQVSGGYAYKTAASGTGANQAFSVPLSGGKAIVKAAIKVVAAGGAGGLLLVGFSTDAAGATPTAGGLRAIGVETNTGKPVYWSGVGGSSPGYLDTGALTPGEWTATVTAEGTALGLTLENAAGTTKYEAQITRTADINNVVIWNTDTRETTGCGIGPLLAKKAFSTARPPTTVENRGPWQLYSTSGGPGANKLRAHIPANYDARKPSPLAIYCHGLGGTATAPFVGVAKNFETALLGAGYIVAAADGYSDTHWGQPLAQAEYLRLYKWCRDNLNIGPVVLIGESMGGLVSLNMLARRTIPGIVAYAGVYPITSLRAAYDSSTGWATDIRGDYGVASDGSDYATKTAGYDPLLQTTADYAGVPMRFWHSASDTIVAKAANTDAFAAKVAGYVPEAGVVATTGDHGDTSNFNSTQQADLLAFFARYVTTA